LSDFHVIFNIVCIFFYNSDFNTLAPPVLSIIGELSEAISSKIIPRKRGKL